MTDEREGPLARAGIALAAWSERWFPDPLVFALLGVVLVFGLGLLLGESPGALAVQGGRAFWSLAPFTLQMVMVIVGGYVVASSRPVQRALAWLAGRPRTPRGAVALVALVSTVSSLLSWGLSLIVSGMLVRQLARRVQGLDYRAAGAAAYLGLGAVWALGLSSSAAMMMATRSMIPASLMSISGLVPLSQTLFSWPSLVMTAVLVVVSVAIAWASTPAPDRARTAAQLGVDLGDDDAPEAEARPARPGEWLEVSPVLNLAVAALLLWYLGDLLLTSERGGLEALDLNTYNLAFLAVGLLLHRTPRRFVRAVTSSVPATGGVLIQFPFYAVIFGLITGSGLSEWLADLFTRISTTGTYPLLVAAYSAVLGVFVPSGGSKWVIEAPYVLQAATVHHVHLGWVVQIYNAAEALPNLVNPFWMLPLLGLLRLKARDLAGYGMLQLLVHVPVVFFLCWLFARFLPYVPPAP